MRVLTRRIVFYALTALAAITVDFLIPRLTTVRQPITELGARAFETLYSMIIDGGQPRDDIILPTRLIRRESCGCPPETTPLAPPQA